MSSRSAHGKNLGTTPAELMQRLDHQLCFALYSSSLVMTKLYKPVLKALGLTYPRYLVLLVLWEADAISSAGVVPRVLSRALREDMGASVFEH